MLFKPVVLSTLAAAAVGVAAGNAPVVTDSTPDYFTAEVHEQHGSIAGTVNFGPGPGGRGVQVDLSFAEFQDQSAVYYYHIHENRVPADGDCAAAGGHVNPYDGSKKCDPTDAAACQAGDLSGKHGVLKSSSAVQHYIEDYLSTNHRDKAFIGERSVVVHDANMKPIACANIVKVAAAGDQVCGSKGKLVALPGQ